MAYEANFCATFCTATVYVHLYLVPPPPNVSVFCFLFSGVCPSVRLPVVAEVTHKCLLQTCRLLIQIKQESVYTKHLHITVDFILHS